jgi:RNA-binding protein 23/39
MMTSSPYFSFFRSDRREKDGDVKDRSHRDKDRKRSSSRDRDRRRRSRSGDRDRHRSRRDSDRDRDRDRSDRHRDRGSRDKDRSRSRDRRESDRDKERSRGGNDKYKEAEKPSVYAPSQEVDDPRVERPSDAEAQALRFAEREAERRKREIDDLTKDQRTVFVSQLTAKVNEGMIRSFFDQLGTVNNIIMIRDKNSGKHKGFAYVEMLDLEAIPNCLLFNNVVPDFQKFPILVKASEAEKNFNAKKETATSVKPGEVKERTGVMGGDPDCRLYIGNIHVNINEIALKTVLEQFGPTENVNLHRDEMGTSKGFAFIRYTSPESALLALTNLAGVELAGRALKVGRVIDNSVQPASGTLPTMGMGVGMMESSGTASANWKLDDDDGGTGMQLNSSSRAMLMAKLGQAAGIQVPSATIPNADVNPLMYGLPSLPAAPSAPVIPAIAGVPSSCFMIRNMFDAAEEGEGDWDVAIKEDVSEECSKYGVVEHCFVERRKPGGIVFLQFNSLNASYQAANSLNGRFFGGRMLTVTFLDPALFFAAIQN